MGRGGVNRCALLCLTNINFKIMINFKSFKNAEEFNEIFGLRECGNGNKSRMNKILLGTLKDKEFFKMCAHNANHPEYRTYLTMVKNMADFKRRLLIDLSDSSEYETAGYLWTFCIDGNKYNFKIRDREMDSNNGICEDGDTKAIRYVNYENDEDGRVQKMKAGKFFTKIIEQCPFGKALPQQAKCWLGEEFTTAWESHAKAMMPDAKYDFHWGNDEEDFEYIYSSEHRRADFHSCMTDEGYHTMYSDAVKAHAAWLTDANGMMFARCVVWDEVHDMETGETLRLAERQYADDVKDVYKKMLVNELVKRNLIDGYKQIGASCHDNRAFVLNDGTSLSGHRLWIDCELDSGDTVSYMDSFVYYNHDEYRAYNYSSCGYEQVLDTTEGKYEGHEGEVYSDYHNEWIDEDDAYYVESEDDYFYDDEVATCAYCGENVLRENALYNDEVDQWFCDEDCEANWMVDNGYVWDELNGCWIDGSDAVDIHRWSSSNGRFNGYFTTDSTELDEDYLYECDGEYYYTDGDDDAEKEIHRMLGQVWSETDEDWIDRDDATAVLTVATQTDDWHKDYIIADDHEGEIHENCGIKFLVDWDRAERMFKDLTLPACIPA